MKALTIHQPWAQLIVEGVKTIETRSWPAPAGLVGERIAIHAGIDTSWFASPPFQTQIGRWYYNVLADGSIESWSLDDRRYRPVPLGCVVGSAVLRACVPMVYDDGCNFLSWMTDEMRETGCLAIDPAAPSEGTPLHELTWWQPDDEVGVSMWSEAVGDQLPFGVFEPGRWAWMLDDAAPTTDRCPMCWGRGHAPTADGLGMIDCCCDGAGLCDPIPARGRQRVWNWEADQ